MLVLLGVIFWLTISGANYPSQLLSNLLFGFQDHLTAFCQRLNVPAWLHGVLILGMYRCLAWVVSVMLPPMAIFFPLFTFLEDLGYLPRVAFNLDRLFKRAGAHGKQVLTMCMGFGCNAVGVTACRIIESPRERLLAILTNNFVPCNGRFPLLITMAMVLLGALVGNTSPFYASLLVAGVVVLGIAVTLLVSWLLSRTLLKGVPSTFTLELPSYRWPKIGSLLIRSVMDRTLFVLMRAVTVAAPAGALIWLLANIKAGDLSIIGHLAGWLQGFGHLIGLDGYIVLAFILGLPANELVIPILIMSYLAEGVMLELDSIEALRALLVANGWTWLTALNMILFSLLHFPCGTTLLTVRKETQSTKWTVLAALIPTGVAILVCFLLTQLVRLAGLV
ncbi:ferrous iron transporter B [Hydrogenispora sp. UU3]|uniref:Ferrous iron transporter B n=2 Tax=Capillibacterium thermochitinicola TaxID=2699427 RepID=A0A8J6HZ37_9FIRM|nr:ferrous iron transporter B [Capillibacterium thermochitinicola]